MKVHCLTFRNVTEHQETNRFFKTYEEAYEQMETEYLKEKNKPTLNPENHYINSFNAAVITEKDIDWHIKEMEMPNTLRINFPGDNYITLYTIAEDAISALKEFKYICEDQGINVNNIRIHETILSDPLGQIIETYSHNNPNNPFEWFDIK